MNSRKMKFFNTLTREKEEFVPINKDEVLMYSCGPTVYNHPHIGNYRAFVSADILKRTLSYHGYQVKHIMNVTDVDDKTIRESQKMGKSLKEFTEFYTEAFIEEAKSLNILPPKKITKATDYIDKMVEIVQRLIEKDLAYKSEDGSVYFSIKKFPGYGALAHLEPSEQKENAAGRIATDEYEKDNIQDFALWKSWDEKDGDVFWETSLGKGRPGWHIECSAMSMATLGEELDIHTGGIDNIFPHHENEIAQSEGVTGKKFVRYWLHNEWMLVDQKKMAKSFNNFFTLRDVIERDIDPLAFRFWLLMANYRTRVNFHWEALEAAEIALKRLYALYLALGDDEGAVHEEYALKFKEFIGDDLNTPRALSLLWDVIKDENMSNADKKSTILNFDQVLGLNFANLKVVEIPEEVAKLVQEREEARSNKDFKKSDELRTQINSLGFEVKDTSEGQKVSKI